MRELSERSGAILRECLEALRAIGYYQCTKCKAIKDQDDFYVDRSVASGRTSWCKLCIRGKNHTEDNREYRRSYMKDYRFRNRSIRNPETGRLYSEERKGRR